LKYHLPRRAKPSAKKHYALIIPDVHIGYIVDTPTYSLGAWDIVMQALRHLRKRLTHVIILGDFGGWESMTHWQSLRADQGFIKEDVQLVNARRDEIHAITGPEGIKVVYLEGNHEAWAGQFEAKYPEVRDAFNLKHQMGIDRRGWVWVPENNFYGLGHLYFTHGHIRGVRTPLDMIKRYGVSVVFGHGHRYMTESLRTLTGEHAAWMMACLCSIDPPPPYARGALPGGWVHGFGVAQIRANGRFQVGFRRIIEEAWTELEDGTELLANPVDMRRRLEQDAAIRERLRAEYSERYYNPGGQVVRTEPHHGKTQAEHSVARSRRARIVRMLPENERG
jgi:metallophosphoesterase superfamily enzyme